MIKNAERGRSYTFTTVHDKTGREETAWRYDLRADTGGTSLTESYEFLWCPIINRVSELPIPRGSQVSRGIQLTLARIKAAAEAASGAA